MNKFKRRLKNILKTFDGIILGNTVLERGMIIAPIVVASTSVKNALVISIFFACITLFAILITSLVPKNTPHKLHVIINTIVAAVVYIPTYFLLNRFFAEDIYKIGFVLPLLIANSIIIYKGETKFYRQKFSLMFLSVFNYVIGFILVAILIGGFREVFGSGTFFGKPISFIYPVGGLLYPFSGFILLGFGSAILNRFTNFLDKRSEKKKIFELEVIANEPIE